MAKPAIIGGGIAGLASGLFAQLKGEQWPIYEKSKALSCQDNLLWIAPNGLRMLSDLGLKDAVLSQAAPQDSMIFSDHMFRPLMQMRAQGLLSHLDAPVVALSRQTLYQLLLDTFLARGGKIHFDHCLEELREEGDVTQLRFTNGVMVSARSVIGADGIGSYVRRQVFPESYVHYQGLRTYLGHTRTPLASRYVGKTIESWGEGLRFVLTSPDGLQVYWSAIERAPLYTPNASPIPEGFPQSLAQLFRDFHPDVAEILKDGDEASLHRCNFGVVKGLPSYVRGRTVLIGDAAHGMPPNMGQGASLGLEDAKFVVEILSRQDTAITAKQIKPREKRAAQMRQLANSMNYMFQPKWRWASRLRNFVAARIPDQLNEHRMRQLYQTPSSLNASAEGPI